MYNEIMEAVYYIFLFIVGTFVGSFLNLVSDRLPKGQKVVFGRSHCDFCKKTLGLKNLVPIFSFIFQKGKCSFCKKKLSFYYIFSEIFTGMLFVLAGYLSGIAKGVSLSSLIFLIYYIVVFSFFVMMFLTDVKFCLILDSLIAPAIIFVLLTSIFVRVFNLVDLYKKLSADKFGVYLIKSGYWNNQLIYSLRDFGYVILSAVVVSLFFMFLVWITKGKGMGFGDVKLGFLIGLVNSLPLSYGVPSVTRYMYVIAAIFLGFILGAIYSVTLILLKKKSMKDTIAFGPFLITGSLLVFLFGNNLLDWYVNLGSVSILFGA